MNTPLLEVESHLLPPVRKYREYQGVRDGDHLQDVSHASSVHLGYMVAF